MKNLKKFNNFVNENKNDKSEYERMVAEIDSEIEIDDWLSPEEAQEAQGENIDSDAQGEEYVVELGAGNKDADKID